MKETLAVAQGMNGWTLEYVLDMGIDAYFYTVDFLAEQAEQLKSESPDIPKTFR